MDRSFLDNHYDSILAVNREKILSGGVGDVLLERALTDSRMSLAVLIRIPLNVAEKINRCIDDLRGIEPNLYYYPAKDFHITVMDVLKGEETNHPRGRFSTDGDKPPQGTNHPRGRFSLR